MPAVQCKIADVKGPGSGKKWTLRIEWVALAVGSTHTAGSWETTWAGWEATPNAIAANPNARYL